MRASFKKLSFWTLIPNDSHLQIFVCYTSHSAPLAGARVCVLQNSSSEYSFNFNFARDVHATLHFVIVPGVSRQYCTVLDDVPVCLFVLYVITSCFACNR